MYEGGIAYILEQEYGIALPKDSACTRHHQPLAFSLGFPETINSLNLLF